MKRAMPKWTIPTLLVWCTIPFGCSTPEHEIKRTSFLLDVHVEPRLDMPELCTFDETTNTCTIFLQSYPGCLLHEIRHCIEGQWHPRRDSWADCY